MREIKFRVWDKQKKIISVIRSWDFAHGDIELDKKLSPNADVFEDEVDIMQFTGLLDKNGKEIYEGDIVKNNRYGGLAEIKWLQGEGSKIGVVGGLFGEKSDLTNFIHNLGGFYFKGISNNKAYYVGEFEVIGNIYETPELLTPKE